MNDQIINYLIIVGLVQTVIFLGIIIYREYQRSTYRWLLILLLFVVAIEIFYGWLYFNNLLASWPHLLRLNSPFVLLVGPAVYLFAKTAGGKALRIGDLWHALPFALCVCYFAPLYFSSAHLKVQYVAELYQGLSFDSYFWGGLRRVQQLSYLLMASITLYYQSQSKTTISPDTRLSFILMMAFGVIWGMDVYRYFFQFDLLSGVTDTITLSIFAIILVIIGLSANQPTLANLNTNIRYRTSSLSSELRNLYKTKIEEAVKFSKPYLNPNLTLPKMSEQLAIKPHHLSQILNEDMQTGFSDFVNSLRIEEAKSMLLDKKAQHLKIEAIAEAVGFNSLSTFNSSFKKFTATTPRRFRAKNLSQNPTTL